MTVAGYGATLLRVVLGAVYLAQAYLALFRATPRGTAAWIGKTAGIPMPTLAALVVIVVLGVGGALLVLGVLTRTAAAANALLVAATEGAVFLRQGTLPRGPLLDLVTERALPAGHEYVALLLAATLAVALVGGGAAAVGRGK